MMSVWPLLGVMVIAAAAVAVLMWTTSVVFVVQEVLWRHRGYPELAPSRRIVDAIR